MKFSRTIKTEYELIDRNKIVSKGYFSDDYHDLECILIFSLPSLEILDAKIKMDRLPKKICRVPLKRIIDLKGLRVKRGFRRKVKKLVGGKEGCIHLTDLIHEIGQSLVAFLRKIQIGPDGNGLRSLPVDIFYGECIGLKNKVDCF